MSKRIFEIAAALIFTFAVFAPIVECFDHWDSYTVPANDTELSVSAWFSLAGLVLTAAKLIWNLVRVGSVREQFAASVEIGREASLKDSRRIPPTGSPPLTPLRI